MTKDGYHGKRLDTGEWVEGCIILFDRGDRGIIPSDTQVRWSNNSGVFSSTNCYAVDPATIGRACGLKDSKNHWLFDGDIIQVRNHQLAIQYSDSLLRWMLMICEDGEWKMWSELTRAAIDGCVKIGSIHDAAEKNEVKQSA